MTTQWSFECPSCYGHDIHVEGVTALRIIQDPQTGEFVMAPVSPGLIEHDNKSWACCQKCGFHDRLRYFIPRKS